MEIILIFFLPKGAQLFNVRLAIVELVQELIGATWKQNTMPESNPPTRKADETPTTSEDWRASISSAERNSGT